MVLAILDKFIAYYFILVLSIGGLAYAPWILASYGIFPSDLISVFVIIGGFSPTIATLIVAKLEYGRSGAKYLFGQFGRKGFSKLWFLAAILIPLVLAASSILLWSMAGGTYSLDFKKLADFPLILVMSFLMNIWEEMGWREYALPVLQKKYSALTSSLIIGAFWAAWHWPHFAVKDSIMAVNYHNFLWFTIFMSLYSISYTWIYNSTHGSLFTVSLYHASTNAVNITLFVEENISSFVFPFYFLTAVTFVSILVYIFFKSFLNKNKQAK